MGLYILLGYSLSIYTMGVSIPNQFPLATQGQGLASIQAVRHTAFLAPLRLLLWLIT